jgi:hypothetical protein
MSVDDPIKFQVALATDDIDASPAVEQAAHEFEDGGMPVWAFHLAIIVHKLGFRFIFMSFGVPRGGRRSR